MAIIYHIPNEQLRQRGLHPRLQANNRLMFITHETAQHSIPEQVEPFWREVAAGFNCA